jgi:hypothetical protein
MSAVILSSKLTTFGRKIYEWFRYSMEEQAELIKYSTKTKNMLILKKIKKRPSKLEKLRN